MNGIYYGLSIIAVFVVVYWYIKNDRKQPNEPTTGLLAMKSTAPLADGGKN